MAEDGLARTSLGVIAMRAKTRHRGRDEMGAVVDGLYQRILADHGKNDKTSSSQNVSKYVVIHEDYFLASTVSF